MTRWGIVAALPLLALVRCASPDPEQLQRAEQALRRVDSLSAQLNAIDTVALAQMATEFERQRPGLEALFADTLAPDTAALAGRYFRAMHEGLPATLTAVRQQREELAESRTKWNDLHQDMLNGAWEEAQERAHTADEEAILAGLSNGSKALVASADSLVAIWRSAHGRVDRILAHRDSLATRSTP